MQPHSMCSLSLANYFWNHDKPKLGSAEVSVSYDNKYGKSTTKYYKVDIERLSPLEFVGWYRHSGGSTQCQITVTRPSVSDDSHLRIVHSIQHVASLVEEVTFRPNKLNGYHRNSMMYGNFNADLHDSKRMSLSCEVKQSDGRLKWTDYKVNVTGEY